MQPHGWFIAFAPADHPRIALAVLVEHGGSGGGAAAPVAREILAHFFGSTRRAARAPRTVRDRHRLSSAGMPIDRRLLLNIDWVLLGGRAAALGASASRRSLSATHAGRQPGCT